MSYPLKAVRTAHRLSAISLGLVLGSLLLPVSALAVERSQAHEERAKAEAKYVEEQTKADAKALEEEGKAQAKWIEERAKGQPKWIGSGRRRVPKRSKSAPRRTRRRSRNVVKRAPKPSRRAPSSTHGNEVVTVHRGAAFCFTRVTLTTL